MPAGTASGSSPQLPPAKLRLGPKPEGVRSGRAAGGVCSSIEPSFSDAGDNQQGEEGGGRALPRGM